MEAAGSHIGPAPIPIAAERQSKSGPGRLLRVASDDRLVSRIRAGDEAAFTVLYERYQGKLLSFCRHMLGNQAEAEDAVQQTYINAYRYLVRSDKEIQARPWLYRIARNQCLTTLRARKQTTELSGEEPSLAGLSEQLGERSDLRQLLADLSALPDDQREALVLSELEGNSHTEVAEILGCDKEKVKSLVFQARSSLIKSREARDVSCTDIQQQLSVLTGGALRRTVIRRHLKQCEGCRTFHNEVKRQRRQMAILLPVIPGAVLKFGAAGALAAGQAAAGVAVTGGAAGGAATAGGGAAAAGGVAAAGGAASGGASAGGIAATVAAKVGVSVAAVKGGTAAVAVGVVAAGGVAGVEAERNSGTQPPHVRGAPVHRVGPEGSRSNGVAPIERAGHEPRVLARERQQQLQRLQRERAGRQQGRFRNGIEGRARNQGAQPNGSNQTGARPNRQRPQGEGKAIEPGRPGAEYPRQPGQGGANGGPPGQAAPGELKPPERPSEPSQPSGTDGGQTPPQQPKDGTSPNLSGTGK